MKYIGLKANTNNGSSALISSESTDWRNVRVGSMIKIGNGGRFYVIEKVSSFLYNKSFTIVGSGKIKINDRVEQNLSIGDEILVNYPQYELKHIAKILPHTNQYKDGDIIEVQEGVACKNTTDNTIEKSKILITDTNNGNIIRAKIQSKGRYFNKPESNSLFELIYDDCDRPEILEREITRIEQDEYNTYITLNYALPENLKEGKISCQKYEILLEENYSGETATNLICEIYRDFTPHLHLPVMLPNSPSAHLVYNQAIKILETEIMSLKQLIKKD